MRDFTPRGVGTMRRVAPVLTSKDKEPASELVDQYIEFRHAVRLYRRAVSLPLVSSLFQSVVQRDETLCDDEGGIGETQFLSLHKAIGIAKMVGKIARRRGLSLIEEASRRSVLGEAAQTHGALPLHPTASDPWSTPYT